MESTLRVLVTLLKVQWAYSVHFTFSAPAIGHCTCTAYEARLNYTARSI